MGNANKKAGDGKPAETIFKDAGQTNAASPEKNGDDPDVSLPRRMTHQEEKRLTVDDFDLLKVLGKGSFGKVSRNFVVEVFEQVVHANVIPAAQQCFFTR